MHGGWLQWHKTSNRTIAASHNDFLAMINEAEHLAEMMLDLPQRD
jgi:hypothetical protein